jgi:hypothetical protein
VERRAAWRPDAVADRILELTLEVPAVPAREPVMPAGAR